MTKSESRCGENPSPHRQDAVISVLRLVAEGKIKDNRIQELVSQVYNRRKKLVKTNGTLYASYWLKDMYYIGSRIALGLEIRPEALKIPCFSDQKARKRVRMFLPLLESSEAALKRVALSILSLGRRWKIPAPYDPRTIVEPYSGTIPLVGIAQDVPTFQDAVTRFGKSFAGERSLKDFINVSGEGRFILSRKAGPNGLASVSWGADAYGIWRQPSLRGRIIELGRVTCDVERILNELPGDCAVDVFSKSFLKLSKSISGRIHQFPESFGKQRVIAIGDLFTQSVLKPIHDFVMNLLRGLESDGTFNQNSMVERVKGWAKQNKRLFSLDLSAATDRLPVVLQQYVLEHILMFQAETVSLRGEGTTETHTLIASLWKDVVSERDFIGPDGAKVRYAVGQPMGFYSSWPMMAITHHFVVHWAGILAGVPFRQIRKYYVLLGDDIVICHSQLAHQYQRVMRWLGVEINLAKSIINFGVAEFAKRLIWRGLDISPVSMQLIMLANNHVVIAPTLFHTLTERGLLSPSDIESVKIFSKVMGKPVTLEILLTCPVRWESNSPYWDRFSDGDYRRFLEMKLSRSVRQWPLVKETIERLDEDYPVWFNEYPDEEEIDGFIEAPFAPWHKPGWFMIDHLRKMVEDNPLIGVTLDELMMLNKHISDLVVLDQGEKFVARPFLEGEVWRSSLILRLFRYLYPKVFSSGQMEPEGP